MPRPKATGGIAKKGTGWVAYYSRDGKQQQRRAKTKELAEAALVELRRGVTPDVHGGAPPPAAPTLSEYEAERAKRREDRRALKDERSRFRLHVAPTLGDRPIGSITTGDMLDLLVAMRRGSLGEATQRHVWTDLVGLFADARRRKAIAENPCIDVGSDERPQKPQRSATQRQPYSHADVETLISDERIPADRRTLFALLVFTGLRFGEAAGLTWADVGRDRIRMTRQWHSRLRRYETPKGKPRRPGAARTIPIHPELAAILAEWKLGGFVRIFKRHPRPEDPIVPSREERPRSVRHAHNKLSEDCERVGVTMRGVHAIRTTMISAARAAGANPDWLERVTHNANGDTLDAYTAENLDAMSAAVSCLPFRRCRMGEVFALPLAASMAESMAATDDEPKAVANSGRSWRGGRDSNEANAGTLGVLPAHSSSQAPESAEPARGEPRHMPPEMAADELIEKYGPAWCSRLIADLRARGVG